MEDVSSVKIARSKQLEYQRHNAEMKRLRHKNHKDHETVVKRSDKKITLLKKTYNDKVDRLEINLNTKLTKMRSKQKRNLSVESSRLSSELNNLKSAHQDRKSELRVTQQRELDSMTQSHQHTVDQARKKFMKEKMKWEAKTEA